MSANNKRRKVLCLGVSYADVPEQLKRAGDGAKERFASCMEDSVEGAINCVRTGLLTQMDGRDLVRCRSTEKTCRVDVYTVSQEKGAIYRADRHLEANFNRRDFVRSLRNKFGEYIKFDEIILDYFWIPAGWDVNHWSRSFFEQTLVSFATENVLNDATAAIYLPFCLHCFRQIQSCSSILHKYFNISFMRKKDLHKISLWRGTQKIDSAVMQGTLGKHLAQEETYCTFGPRDVYEAMDDPAVSKNELAELARSLEDFGDIRFIRLQLLPQRKSRRAKANTGLGKFIGTKNPCRVERGYDRIGSPARDRSTSSPISISTPVVTPARACKTRKVPVPSSVHKRKVSEPLSLFRNEKMVTRSNKKPRVNHCYGTRSRSSLVANNDSALLHNGNSQSNLRQAELSHPSSILESTAVLSAFMNNCMAVKTPGSSRPLFQHNEKVSSSRGLLDDTGAAMTSHPGFLFDGTVTFRSGSYEAKISLSEHSCVEPESMRSYSPAAVSDATDEMEDTGGISQPA